VVDPSPLGRETVQNLKHFRFIEKKQRKAGESEASAPAAPEPEDTNTGDEEQEITEAIRGELRQLRKALEGGEIRIIYTLLKNFTERKMSPRLRQALAVVSDHVLVSEFDEAKDIIDIMI
jgi:hypothetical protein